MATKPEEVVRRFCETWSQLDIEQIMPFFSDNAIYHNMPGPPLEGRTAVRQGIARFLGAWTATTWEIRNIAAAGNIVLTERIDRIDAGGKHVDLPVCGVFEVDRHGKIVAWRDYFDLATYTRAMS